MPSAFHPACFAQVTSVVTGWVSRYLPLELDGITGRECHDHFNSANTPDTDASLLSKNQELFSANHWTSSQIEPFNSR